MNFLCTLFPVMDIILIITSRIFNVISVLGHLHSFTNSKNPSTKKHFFLNIWTNVFFLLNQLCINFLNDYICTPGSRYNMKEREISLWILKLRFYYQVHNLVLMYIYICFNDANKILAATPHILQWHQISYNTMEMYE